MYLYYRLRLVIYTLNCDYKQLFLLVTFTLYTGNESATLAMRLCCCYHFQSKPQRYVTITLCYNKIFVVITFLFYLCMHPPSLRACYVSVLAEIYPEMAIGWYVYMENTPEANIRGNNSDPGEQGHWIFIQLSGDPYRYLISPK